MRYLTLIAALLAAPTLHAETPEAPRRAPEFVLNFPDGSQKLLSSYRGKVVVIEFLYTTCPHCQHASQVFSQMYREYGAKGFQPLGVAWNEMARMLVPDFVKSFQVNYPVAYAERDKVMDFMNFSPMLRTVVPQIVWIDRKGMIRSQTPAPGDEKLLQEKYWRDMVETLTAESDVTAKKTATHIAAHKAVAR